MGRPATCASVNSYKNAQPDRASRKVIRLVHEIRAIPWELCESADAALLRENELLRLHKPKRIQEHQPCGAASAG